MGEDGSGAEVPGRGVRGEDGDAGDVGGQQVGMALDPGQLAPERGGQGPGQDGLADAGDVLDEQVVAGQGGHHRDGHRPRGAEEDLRTSARWRRRAVVDRLVDRTGHRRTSRAGPSVGSRCLDARAHAFPCFPGTGAPGRRTRGAWLPTHPRRSQGALQCVGPQRVPGRPARPRSRPRRRRRTARLRSRGPTAPGMVASDRRPGLEPPVPAARCAPPRSRRARPPGRGRPGRRPRRPRRPRCPTAMPAR